MQWNNDDKRHVEETRHRNEWDELTEGYYRDISMGPLAVSGACLASGISMIGGFHDLLIPYATQYLNDPEKELNKMVIEKFMRQLIPDPAEYNLITKYFDFTPTTLMMLMFFPKQVYKTAVALETEKLRKKDIDYENKIFIGEGGDRSFSIKDMVKDPPPEREGEEPVEEKKPFVQFSRDEKEPEDEKPVDKEPEE